MSSTAVFAALGACRTPGDVVPAAAYGVGNVAENLEALVLASIGGQLGPRFRRDWVRDGHHSGGEGVEVLPCMDTTMAVGVSVGPATSSWRRAPPPSITCGATGKKCFVAI